MSESLPQKVLDALANRYIRELEQRLGKGQGDSLRDFYAGAIHRLLNPTDHDTRLALENGQRPFVPPTKKAA